MGEKLKPWRKTRQYSRHDRELKAMVDRGHAHFFSQLGRSMPDPKQFLFKP